jgi:glutamyl-Q tRNA(Asp) synthetase
VGDYIIVRRDGLPAYHLAVVLDDAAQGITDVVRGADLLDSTPVHVHLQGALRLPTPRYCHVPVAVNALGQKLSKQTGADAVSSADASAAAWVLQSLGLAVPDDLRGARPRELWQWALPRFDLESLRGQRTVPAP